jgi:hypothetical protein
MTDTVSDRVWEAAVEAATQVQNTGEAFIPVSVARPRIAQNAVEAYLRWWGREKAVKDVEFTHEHDGLRLRRVGRKRHAPEEEVE